MADLLRPDVIGMDPGVRGTIENELNPAGIDAVTAELGAPEVFDPVMIERALIGIRNLMIDAGMVTGTLNMSGPEPFIGNNITDITAQRGGFLRVKVALGQKVKAGDQVATVSDPFGTVTATAIAPHDGQVLSVATSPIHEIGEMIVRLIYFKPPNP
jgi:predicted deacylase